MHATHLVEVVVFKAQFVQLQGPGLQATLYKVIRLKAFGLYVNSYGMALTPVATIDKVELVRLDFPNLDIRNSKYGYDEVSRDKASWLLVKTMVRLPELLLL